MLCPFAVFLVNSRRVRVRMGVCVCVRARALFARSRGLSQWVVNNDQKDCSCCNLAFTLMRRRHHCRRWFPPL